MKAFGTKTTQDQFEAWFKVTQEFFLQARVLDQYEKQHQRPDDWAEQHRELHERRKRVFEVGETIASTAGDELTTTP